MKKCFLLLVVVVACFQARAQVRGAAENLKQAASQMGGVFVNGDYKAFVNYTYPPVVRLAGGTANMAAMLEKSIGDMKAQGTSFTHVSFDEPSAMVTSGKELQATIGQHIELKLKDGRLMVRSTLIAISADNGLHWIFIDTSNKNVDALRKAFPNLSPMLVIPPPAPPVKYN